MKKLEAETQKDSKTSVLPFVFYSDSMSTALGLGAVSSGVLQPQASLFGIGVYSSNDSWVYYLAALNYQVPQWQQWLFTIDAYNSDFTQGRYLSLIHS